MTAHKSERRAATAQAEEAPSGSTAAVRQDGPPSMHAVRSITLPYLFGDLCFLRITFSAKIENTPFDPTLEPLQLPLEPPMIPNDVSVVVQFARRVPDPILPLYSHLQALCYIRNRRMTHYVDMSGTFEKYVGEFSSKRRGNFRREVRNLAKMADGTMEMRVFRGSTDVSDFHRLAREVAVKTYQERLFDGAIPATSDFVDNLRKRGESDSYRGYVLLVRGNPVAYIYLPVDNGVIDFRYLGYDPDFAPWSPGSVLLYMAFESLFGENKFRFFNLSFGEGQMKRVFGRSTFLQGDLYFFRWTIGNVLAVYAHLATDKFSRSVGLVLESLGIRKRMRKLLRSYSNRFAS